MNESSGEARGTYKQTYMHTYAASAALLTYKQTYMHTYAYIHKHTYKHTYSHTYTQIHTYINTHTKTNTRRYTHIQAHEQTHIHAHTHTYTHKTRIITMRTKINFANEGFIKNSVFMGFSCFCNYTINHFYTTKFCAIQVTKFRHSDVILLKQIVYNIAFSEDDRTSQVKSNIVYCMED